MSYLNPVGSQTKHIDLKNPCLHSHICAGESHSLLLIARSIIPRSSSRPVLRTEDVTTKGGNSSQISSRSFWIAARLVASSLDDSLSALVSTRHMGIPAPPAHLIKSASMR